MQIKTFRSLARGGIYSINYKNDFVIVSLPISQVRRSIRWIVLSNNHVPIPFSQGPGKALFTKWPTHTSAFQTFASMSFETYFSFKSKYRLGHSPTEAVTPRKVHTQFTNQALGSLSGVGPVDFSKSLCTTLWAPYRVQFLLILVWIPFIVHFLAVTPLLRFLYHH